MVCDQRRLVVSNNLIGGTNGIVPVIAQRRTIARLARSVTPSVFYCSIVITKS